MALRVYDHGSCCGAKVIDGFWDYDSYYNDYIQKGYTKERSEVLAKSYPSHEKVVEELRKLLVQYKHSTGHVSVILNQAQKPAWHKTLTEMFGFKLVVEDVSNPNHASNENSQLFLYSRTERYFQGDREAAGLPVDAPPATPLPEPPPPPPTPVIPKARAGLSYGRAI